MALPLRVSVVLLILPSIAQAVEGLRTCGSGLLVAYHSELKRRFVPDDTGVIKLSVNAVPGRGAEWGVYLVERDGKYYVRSSKASRSLWYSSIVETKEGGSYWDFSRAVVAVTSKERQLSPSVASSLIALANAAIDHKVEPEEIVLDSPNTMYTIATGEEHCGVLDTNDDHRPGLLEHALKKLFAFGVSRVVTESSVARAASAAGRVP